MHALPPKESLYAIEPWNDEPSTFPNSFLPTHHFAKTAFLPSGTLKSAHPLQIATNSVYLIKNQPEIDASPAKRRLRFHCTAQNSPRINPQDSHKSPFKRGLSDRLTRSHQMLKSYKKTTVDDDLVHPKFQQTKQTFIEFKLIKRSRRSSLGDPTKDSKTNLKKKYEKSNIGKDLKKKEPKVEEGFEEIYIRRKLKTEKSNLESVKNLLTYMEDPEKTSQPKLPLPLQQNSQISIKDSLAGKEDTGMDKLKFELLMERKLFLMKNNLNKWHKNSENNSNAANRMSK